MKIFFHKLIISFFAVIKTHVNFKRFLHALYFSIYRFFSDGILKWEEWPPPRNYEGCLPPIHMNTIKALLKENKLEYDIIKLDIDYFLPDYKYQSRKELIDIIKIDDANEERIKKTYMYRNKGMNRCLEIKKLFNNVVNNGFIDINENFDNSFDSFPPCYLEMPNKGIRIDGTNRAAVLKYLGKIKISVLRIKAMNLFGIKLPSDGRENEGNMRMEIIKHWFHKYQKFINKNFYLSKNIFSANWYQDIELAPGVYTHAIKEEQTDLWLNNVPSLKGRKMIDLGCCNGNYSFSAIDKGASKVLGVDISKVDIKRAKFAQKLKTMENIAYNNIEFKNENILKNLSIIKDYDTFNASNVLYLLGPQVHDLMKAIKEYNIDLLILQGQLKRKNRIGEYNALGVKGYEKSNKTWGNILGTVEGLTNITKMYGYKIDEYHDSSNWPLLIAKK